MTMMIYRISPKGLEFYISEAESGKLKVRLKGTSKLITITSTLEAFSASFYRWLVKGEFIQVAFSQLNSEEREFLMTGITPEEWKELFTVPEDDAAYQQYLKEFPKHDPRD